MRSTLSSITSRAASSGTRHAIPSASKVLTGAATARPASNDRAYAGASSATTPTIFVFNPSPLRTAQQEQMPEPWPIGTYTKSRPGAAEKNSSQ